MTVNRAREKSKRSAKNMFKLNKALKSANEASELFIYPISDSRNGYRMHISIRTPGTGNAYLPSGY